MASPSYMSLVDFRARTLMPKVDVDAVEADTPGFILQRLTSQTSRINARLRKNYAAPFTLPYPEVVLEWLTKIVTYEAYLKRGVDPSDQTLALIKADKDLADAELKEAADTADGKWDIPMSDALDASAKTKGAPLFYTEVSPYGWTDLQRTSGSSEDSSGGSNNGG